MLRLGDRSVGEFERCADGGDDEGVLEGWGFRQSI
jgi:hypothetical protein